MATKTVLMKCKDGTVGRCAVVVSPGGKLWPEYAVERPLPPIDLTAEDSVSGKVDNFEWDLGNAGWMNLRAGESRRFKMVEVEDGEPYYQEI